MALEWPTTKRCERCWMKGKEIYCLGQKWADRKNFLVCPECQFSIVSDEEFKKEEK